MYLTNHDLYDLYHLLCSLRACPEAFSACMPGIKRLSASLSEPADASLSPGFIRRCLQPFIPKGSSPMFSWVHLPMEPSPPVRVLKQIDPGLVATAIVKELLQTGGHAGQLYLLCDATHNIPLCLADPNHIHAPYGEMLEPYREAYNPDFLRQELAGL